MAKSDAALVDDQEFPGTRLNRPVQSLNSVKVRILRNLSRKLASNVLYFVIVNNIPLLQQ